MATITPWNILASHTSSPSALRARDFAEQAMDGNVQAIREIADRIDGKVPTPVVGNDAHGPNQINMITKIERTFSRPDPREESK